MIDTVIYQKSSFNKQRFHFYMYIAKESISNYAACKPKPLIITSKTSMIQTISRMGSSNI